MSIVTTTIQNQGIQDIDALIEFCNTQYVNVTYSPLEGLLRLYFIGKQFDKTPENPFQKACNGLILYMNNMMKVAAHGYECFEEYNELPNNIEYTDIVEMSIVPDGTVLKYFYNHESKSWNIATNRTVSAYWRYAYYTSPRVFGALFDDAANIKRRGGIDNEALDTNVTYVFVLQHPENIIANRFSEPGLIHVLSKHNETNKTIPELNVYYSSGEIIPKCTTIYKNTDSDMDHATTMNILNSLNMSNVEGILFTRNDDSYFKVYTTSYLEEKEKRKINNLIFHRFIKNRGYDRNWARVKSDKEKQMEHECATRFSEIVSLLHKEYMQTIVYKKSYRRKKWSAPTEEILANLHSIFKGTKQQITPNYLSNYLFDNTDKLLKFIHITE